MKRIIGMILLDLTLASVQVNAQTNEIVALIQNFEASAAAGKPRSPEEAEPLIERFGQISNEDLSEALPSIAKETGSPYVSVRRLAAMSLFAISLRPDGQALLSTQTKPLSAFLIDSDVPVRRLMGLTIDNLHLDQHSLLLPSLVAFLSRTDAVSTIGAGIAGLIMRAAPDDATSITAVVKFMQRKDQTTASRSDLLQSVRVSRSHNREIGKAVAAYTNDSSKELTLHAIETLQSMGADVVSNNQRVLSKLAADTHLDSSVRIAASKALSLAP